MSEKWDRRFLELAESIATWSKDPDRGVGCVIASTDRRVCATGFNGLPSGVEDLPDRLARPAKYDLMCHAEANAIIQCARHGVSPIGATIYSTFFPCIQCALMIVQAGLARVVSKELTEGDEHWAESVQKSQAIFTEAGIDWEMLS
ncbi:MAG: dCMP deaminase family protein [Phycisphaerales bacterium]|nr:CMP deaminase [Phycisphaerae bacterium]MCH2152963.1 dCMP deaminase family protein [Phycisphaerales bacterium]